MSAVAKTGSLPDSTFMLREYRKCRRSFAYFCDTYCQILSGVDDESATWQPFRLWPAQIPVANALQRGRLTVILKARQIGLSWLVIAYALWLMLFHPIATVLLFSRRDNEAVKLLEKLTGMYERLPEWLRARSVMKENDHEFVLSNGSTATAFPCNAGDSYTATLAVLDEFDVVDEKDQAKLMRAVKPTTDGGGRMILLSRSDKTKPDSVFKRTYRAAKQGLSTWQHLFLPWHARPDRDNPWYEEQRAEILSRTGSLDDLHEQYPATDEEALAPASKDKRIHPDWIRQCYEEVPPLDNKREAFRWGERFPAIPGLTIYSLPKVGRRYVVGADPAEGNPTSDDSALEVLNRETGEQVATLAGPYQTHVFGGHIDAVGIWYNKADVLVERNNHGHAVLLWLKDNSRLRVIVGLDKRPGWLDNTKGKTMLYDAAAEAFRESETIVHSFATMQQLQSIEGRSLRAPEGQPDDRADAYALALVAIQRAPILQGTPGLGAAGQGSPGMF